MKEHVVHVRQRTMRYLEAGDGRSCLLLHSFPLSADQWKPQLENVPSGWRFIAPDLFGLGPSPHGDADVTTMDQQAEDVVALMDQLGVTATALVGVSMGGYVAFAVLRRISARVTALVLADTRATPDAPDGRAARDRTIEIVEREGVEPLAHEMLPKLLGATTHRERPDVVTAVTNLIRANDAAAVCDALVAIRDRPDSTPLLARVRCPTLILCGGEDVITPPADSEAMQRAIVGSRLEILPGAGHLSNLEDPAAFSRALEAFLQ